MNVAMAHYTFIYGHAKSNFRTFSCQNYYPPFSTILKQKLLNLRPIGCCCIWLGVTQRQPKTTCIATSLSHRHPEPSSGSSRWHKLDLHILPGAGHAGSSSDDQGIFMTLIFVHKNPVLPHCILLNF